MKRLIGIIKIILTMFRHPTMEEIRTANRHPHTRELQHLLWFGGFKERDDDNSGRDKEAPAIS